LREVERRLRERREVGLLALLDGKPLPVSGVSKDPDARPGRGAGGKGKGYKLHTLWANRALPEAWEVTPLNEAETTVARRPLGEGPGAGHRLGGGHHDPRPGFDPAAGRGPPPGPPPPRPRRRPRPRSHT